MPKKGKKKDKAPKISYYEALLGYKIGLKEKELEDANFAAKELTAKNEEFKKRVSRLNETRNYYLNKAIKDNKKFLNDVDNEPKCTREDVQLELEKLWLYKKAEEDKLREQIQEIKNTEKQISKQKKELRSWVTYRDRYRHDYDVHIRLLKQEIEDMTRNYEIISYYEKQKHVVTIDSIEKKTNYTVATSHKNAAEKIFNEMDKYTSQMVIDNNWMEEKIKQYLDMNIKLNNEANELEQENIKLMSQLLECNTSDLKIVKNAYQYQFKDGENLELNSILDIDLDKLDTLRPDTALGRAVKKVVQYTIDEVETSEDEGDLIQENDETNDIFKLTSYDNLGPFDYKVLKLDGSQKKVIPPKTPTKEELEALDFKNNEWPITQDMLKITLNL